jgi:hypothetical protein
VLVVSVGQRSGGSAIPSPAVVRATGKFHRRAHPPVEAALAWRCVFLVARRRVTGVNASRPSEAGVEQIRVCCRLGLVGFGRVRGRVEAIAFHRRNV